jgi:nickel-type superoxide dismutase maturation protease
VGAIVWGTVILVRCVRRFRRVQVVGDSMQPAVLAGDRLIVGPHLLAVRVGQVVALPDPRAPARLMVKRVHSIAGGWVDVRGDNEEASTDSRRFGSVPRAALTGRVWYRYGPRGRTGWMG